jgi:hypothetical protein
MSVTKTHEKKPVISFTSYQSEAQYNERIRNAMADGVLLF